VNFNIASVARFMPIAAGSYVPDAFDSNGNGRGITWGLCHFINASDDPKKSYSILARFDCDLSLDVDDKEMKNTRLSLKPDIYFSKGLSEKQRKERIGSISE
ncbi:MAG: glycoside hydrolase, partial [Bacteroidota bacterium]